MAASQAPPRLLEYLILENDGPATLERLREMNWDGASPVSDDDDSSWPRFFQPLLLAVEAESSQVVESILQYEKIQVNIEDRVRNIPEGDAYYHYDDEPLETSALHLACTQGNLSLIRLLLQAGANPNLELDTKVTPLWSLNKDLNVLIARNQVDRLRVMAMHASGEADTLLHDNLECRRALLEAGADPNLHRVEGDTLLHFDCRHGRNLHARLLIQHGATSSPTEREESREMDLALSTLNPELLQILHSYNQQGQVRFNYSGIDTCLSIWYDRFRLVKERDETYFNKALRTVDAYLDTGVSPNARHSWSVPILHGACKTLKTISESNAYRLVHSLVRRGVNLNQLSYVGGETPLMCAVGDESLAMMAALLRHGADVNSVDGNGDTALFLYRGNQEILNLLVEHGADLEVQNERGSTALIQAARRGSTGNVEDLLSVHANVHATNNSGWTALHNAAFLGCYDSIKLLLEADAPRDLRTVNGETCLHVWGLLYWKWPERESIAEWDDGFEFELRDDIDQPDIRGLDLLLEHGADPRAVDSDGNLPFASLASVPLDRTDHDHLSGLYTMLRSAATYGLFSSLPSPSE